GVVLAAIPCMRGRFAPTRKLVLYGLGCATLLNIPFALSLFFSRHVAATEYGLIVSTAPLWNYLLALTTRRESVTMMKLLAVGAGFLSSAVLILTRGNAHQGELSWWVIGAFCVPIVYSVYNWFAARFWPKDSDIMVMGALESIFSGLLAIPFMLVLAPPWDPATPSLLAYWSAAAATVMWIIERIAFFTLIRDRGAVYTIQAIYVATPAAVLWAILFFGNQTDPWIWVSLAILMVALWLNNRRAVPVAA
ncbi:MAG: DMT family transporter, partial [Parvibaculaceae bacterium]